MSAALTRQTLTRRGVIVLSAVCLSCLMFGLEISSIPAILPTLEQVLHADFKQLQWIMNAYTIAVTTVLMATGTLADRYGRKRMFAIFIAAFGLTSLVCGLAENVVTLIVARFLQGASGGAMLICQVAVLSYEFKGGKERASAFGWWGVMFGIGLGFGPLIGGAIVAALSWKWVFLVHAVFASVALALTLGGVVLAALFAVLAGYRPTLLAGTVCFALLGNATMCGVISGPHDRYGARLVWIATFTVLLAAARWFGDDDDEVDDVSLSP